MKIVSGKITNINEKVVTFILYRLNHKTALDNVKMVIKDEDYQRWKPYLVIGKLFGFLKFMPDNTIDSSSKFIFIK